MYGFAKITGAQFTVLDSELDKPLREVSGFWLTWHYFSYSSVYGTLVALIQVAGAIALMVRRTALLAACVLLPVVGNILLINVFFAIDAGAFVAALLIMCALLTVLVAHRQRLAQLLLPAPPEPTRKAKSIKLLVTTAVILLPLGFAYYLANYNNRRPTPIDGTWRVVNARAAGPDLPTHVYFERNRAFMCVFRYAHGTSVHHFEVDGGQSRVRVWAAWLTKGPPLLEGTYDTTGKTIELTGRLPGSLQPVTLELAKVRPPGVAGPDRVTIGGLPRNGGTSPE